MKHAGAAAARFAREAGLPPAALIFGPDRGAVRALADEMVARKTKAVGEAAITRLTEDDLKADPRRLADALAAQSLFGGVEIVRLKLSGEAGAPTILKTLEEIEAGRLQPAGMLVVEAGELASKSKLRAAFEAARAAAALQTFALDAGEAADFVRQRLKALGVSIQPEALELFLADLALDRDSAAAEADKLALFSADLSRPIEIAEVEALSAAAREGDGERAAARAVGGDVAGALQEGRRALAAGASGVQMTRAVERRLRRVLEVRAGVASGRGVMEAIAALQPPVFRSDQQTLARDVEAWSREALGQALAAARETELGLKRAGAAEAPLVERLLAGVARRRRA